VRTPGGGYSKEALFWKVAVPLSRPILAVVAIFAANAAWSDFLPPFIVLRSDALQTVMVKIYTLQAARATSAFLTNAGI